MKSKKKRGARLNLDLVTALTPDECRDVLQHESEHFSGVGRQTVVLEGEGRFRVERTARLGLITPLPLRFEGTLIEVLEGTRVKGHISDVTLAHIKRRIRWYRIAGFAIVVAYMIISVLIPLDSNAPLSWLMFRQMIVLMMALGLGPSIFGGASLRHYAVQLVNWLDKYLYVTPDPLSVEDTADDDREPQVQSEEEARRAAESGLRDGAHTG